MFIESWNLECISLSSKGTAHFEEAAHEQYFSIALPSINSLWRKGREVLYIPYTSTIVNIRHLQAKSSLLRLLTGLDDGIEGSECGVK